MARFLNLNVLVFVLVCLAATAAQDTKTITTPVGQPTTEVEKLPVTPEPPVKPVTVPDVPAEKPKEEVEVVEAPAPVKEEKEEPVVVPVTVALPPKPDDKAEGKGMVTIAETPLQENLLTPPNILGSTTFGGDLTEAVYTNEAPDKSMMDKVANSLSNPLGGALDGELSAEDEALKKLEAENLAKPQEASANAVTDLTGKEEATAAGGADKYDVVLEDANKDIANSVGADPVTLYISSFECDLAEILVSESENYVTCSVAAESSKGVSAISAAFYNVPMTKRILMHFGEEDLISGNVKSGIWQLDLTIPKAADQGVWSLGFADQSAFYGLEITDKAGNTVDYAKKAAVETIIPLQTTLTVKSYTGNNVAYPQANIQTSSGVLLYGVSCVDDTATVTDESKTIICEALVIPDEAGIGKATIYLVGPTGTTILPLVFDEDSEALMVPATNTTTAMYLLNSTLSVPTWAEAGTYILPASGAYQSRTLSNAGTVRLVNPLTLSSKPALKVVSAADKSPPRVSSFYCNIQREIKLDDFNTVPVSCMLTASNEHSGISYASLHFVSPSKNDAVEFAFVPASPGLGPFPAPSVTTVRETVGAQFPPNTEPGAWTLVRAVVADNSGNYKEYTPSELKKEDVQTFFLVQSSLKTFSIAPRAGTPAAGAEPIPGQATSGASRSTASMVAMAAAGAVAAVCAMS